MAKKRIVILGGGYAGIAAAKKLHKKYKKENGVEITLIDKNIYHTLMTELHEVAGSRVEPDSVQISYARIFSGTNIKVVIDTVTSIDFENRKVIATTDEFDYDYLVLGTGGAPEFFDVPGIQENSFTLWSFEDAIRIRDHVEERFRQAAHEASDRERRRMLTFTVAGAGFTGIELAGELLERRDTLCREYHIDRADVRILIVEALDKILPIMDEKLRSKALNYLKKKGAEIQLGTRITGAEEGTVKLADGSSIETDTFVWTCGIHGSEFTSKISLTKGQEARGQCSVASEEGIHGFCGCRFEEDETYVVGKRGRILVDEYMRSSDYPEVYAVGDNMWFVYEEHVLPQIVETALQTGETAAENIIADMEGAKKKAFAPNYHGFMVSIGGRYAVSNAGGFRSSGFIAMAMKHLVNLHYLWSIAGLNSCWGYLKHEFFDMKERRTFIGGHLSWKIQSWWSFPLRLWLGLMWVVEGVNKIGEGWFNFSGGSRSGWMFSPGVKQAGVEETAAAGDAAADEVSAASGDWDAAEAAGDAASGTADTTAAAADSVSAASGDWGAAEAAGDAASGATDTAAAAADSVSAASGDWGAAEAAGDAASGAADSAAAAADSVSAASGDWGAADAAAGAAGDAASGAADAAGQVFEKFWDTGNTIIPYDSAFVTWFRETFMDNIAAYIPFPLFQVMIVVVEIGIGLALMGGLFTWIAAAASIVMCLVFTFSGMFAWNQVWFIFAAFLLMGGAGRSLGLDHWVMPALKKWWNGTKLAKKSHLYVNEPVIKRKKK